MLIENAIRTQNDCLISHGALEWLNIVEDTLYLDATFRHENGCKALIRGQTWQDFDASVDMRMPDGEGAGLLLHCRNVGARKYMMQGYAVRLCPRFGLQILRVEQPRINGARVFHVI